MIDSEFLADLRRRLRCELLLTMVQAEQLCPGWWADLQELADQLGTDRATLNRSLIKLEALGLLRRARIGNCGGNWIWWVKRSPADRPNDENEPGWVLRDRLSRKTSKVAISDRHGWADRRNIPRETMRSLLNGHRKSAHGRWEVAASPWDVPEEWGADWEP